MRFLKSFKKYLEEKSIVPGKGKRFGQAILLAGGAGSGKSFAVSQFIDSLDYKVMNPDDVIVNAIRLANKGVKGFENLKGKDITNPDDLADVFHDINVVRELPQKKLANFFKGKDMSRLPNIILDRTFKGEGSFKEWAQKLRTYGYKPENIHTVWVFTEVDIALTQNRQRKAAGDRFVPEQILLMSHSGAKLNMRDLIFGRLKSSPINGDIFIVFGGLKNTVFYGTPEGELPPKGQKMVVKDFKYLKVKSAGRRMEKTGQIARKVASVFKNIR